MSIPGKGHKGVGGDQQQDGIDSAGHEKALKWLCLSGRVVPGKDMELISVSFGRTIHLHHHIILISV